jgi:hypothetical protein
MSRNLFLRITNDLENNYEYFKQRPDARGQMGFTAMQKVTAALRALAYGSSSDVMDEYLRMAERTARESTQFFCAGVIDLYLKRYLRKPTFSDVHQLLEFHEEKHGFPGMLGSIDCMKWEWEVCPTEWQGQHASGFHKRPCMMLEAVASQDLWIWHAFFGVPGSLNDRTILNQSPIFNDLVNDVAPKGTFFVNGVEYKYGYLLADGIYPDWPVFVKSFTRRTTLDPKRKQFNKAQMAARKDVERAFGVLQKRWRILAQPCRLWEKAHIRNVMYACIILHNMILEDEERAICEYFGEETQQSQANITDEERNANNFEIKSSQTHHNLRADLVDHIWSVPRDYPSDEDDSDN